MVEVTLDQRAMDRAIKRLKRYEGRELQKRAQQAYLEGARLMVGPMRRAGRYQDKTGTLRRSIKARRPRLRPGEMAVAAAGPTARHRHLIIRGHRIVTPGGRDTGRRTQPDPFVDQTYSAMGGQVRSFINARVVGLGETFRAM